MSKEQAAQIVASWQFLHYFPKDDAPLEAAVEAVARYVKPGQHQTAFVEHWKHHETDFPTPADIYRVAKATIPETPENDCKECDGTGWRTVHIGKYSAVQPCGCKPCG